MDTVCTHDKGMICARCMILQWLGAEDPGGDVQIQTSLEELQLLLDAYATGHLSNAIDIMKPKDPYEQTLDGIARLFQHAEKRTQRLQAVLDRIPRPN